MCEVVASIVGFNDFSSDLYEAFPVLWLLLVDIPEKEATGSSQEAFTRKMFRGFLWDILHSSVHRQIQSPSDLEGGLERLLKPNPVPHIWLHLSCLKPAQISSFNETLADIMTSGLLPYEFPANPNLAKHLLRWLVRSRPQRSSLSFKYVSRGFPRAIEKLSIHFLWENERPTTLVRNRADRALENFRWLLFILKEINHLLASEDDIEDYIAMEKHGQLLEHIGTCITTLQLLRASDDSPERGLYTHDEHGLSESSPAHGFAHRRVCILFCMFRTEMIQSAKLVHRKAPFLRLDASSWQRLIQALTAPGSNVRSEKTWDPNITSMHHQEHVRQDILEAFHWLSLEPLASGTFVHTTMLLSCVLHQCRS